MIANKIKILRQVNDRQVIVPLSINWDFSDRGDTIDAFQDDVIRQVLGIPVDYELARFTKKPITLNQQINTSVIHEFNFYNPTNLSFYNSYVNSGLFTFDEVYYNSKSFDSNNNIIL